MNISVALCTYNGAAFIKEQIESILFQTTKVSEIIVCDDCSRDDTIEIIRRLATDDPEINFIINTNKKVLGAKKNFEKALSICTGDYMFLSDQDDIWHPEKVKESLNIFDKYPSLLGLATDSDLIDEKGNSLQQTAFQVLNYLSNENTFSVQGKLSLFDFLLYNYNVVTGATICLKKEAKEKILPFPNLFLKSKWHDEWIATRLAFSNQFLCVNKALIKYRVHPGQQIGLGKKGYEESSLLNLQKQMFVNKCLNKELEKDANFGYVGFYSQLSQDILLYEKCGINVYSRSVEVKEQLQFARRDFLLSKPFLRRKLQALYWLVFRKFSCTYQDVFL